jgi:exo-1,4-beta-D-glucosaminidase
MTITLSLPASGKTVALFEHLVIRNSPRGDLVLPVLWSDNDVTLWPGESVTLTARYATMATAQPVVQVSGWNVPTRDVVPDGAGNPVQ